MSQLGCGPKPQVDVNRTTVSGTVTFDGKPLPAGSITFQSIDKAIGTPTAIRSGGRYITDRAPLGSNVVTIETESIQYGNMASYIPIPAKYADPTKSDLSIDVKPGTNENVNFDLKP